MEGRSLGLFCKTSMLLMVALCAFPFMAGAETYAIGPGSAVTYHVVHPLHDVYGTATNVTGTFRYDPDQPLATTGVAGQHVEIPWTAFNSGNANRDANVLETVKADKYPKLYFVVEGFNDLSQNDERIQGKVRGRLYVAGVKRTMEAPIAAQLGSGSAIPVTAQLQVKMTEFGLERPSLMFIPTKDSVGIDIFLRMVPIPEAGDSDPGGGP